MGYYIIPHSSPADLSSCRLHATCIKLSRCMSVCNFGSTASLYHLASSCAVHILACSMRTWCIIMAICALKCTHSTIKAVSWTLVLLFLFLLQKAVSAQEKQLQPRDIMIMTAISISQTCCLASQHDCRIWFSTACSDRVICMQLWWCGGCVWRWQDCVLKHH